MSQLQAHDDRLAHAHELLKDEFFGVVDDGEPLASLSWRGIDEQAPLHKVVAELIADNPDVLRPILAALMHAASVLDNEHAQLVIIELSSRYAVAYAQHLDSVGAFDG